MKQLSLVAVCTVLVLVLGMAVGYFLFGPAPALPPVRAVPSSMAAAVASPAVSGESAPLYPALYVCHGAGPMPVLGDRLHADMVAMWEKHMADIIAKHGRPTAVAVVSAHYSTEVPTFGGAAVPAMDYDYGGFPKAAYSLRYDAPGEPSLAMEMAAALRAAGLESRVDAKRAYDHGVFVPLMKMLPDADIPVIPVSVLHGDDPEAHIRVGLALRPFRARGVFFLGSGSSMHHFKYFAVPGAGKEFGDSLTQALQGGAGGEDDASARADRLQAMLNVARMPGFPQAQPSGATEHLMPLLTLFGTANATAATEVASVPFMLANVRHYLFEH